MKTVSYLRGNILLAFAGGILALLSVSVISYLAVVRSNDSEQMVRHTHEVIEHLQDVRVAMENIESSYRGFVITGNENFLKPYRVSVSGLDQDVAAIRTLTADNQRQQERIPAVETLIAEKLQFAEMTIQLRRTGGAEAAAAVVRRGQGQQIMDVFRDAVHEMQNEELRLLELRNADSAKHLSGTKSLLIFGAIIGLLIACGAGWSVQRGGAARRKAEEAVREGEERFRMMANNISQLAWMANHEGYIFWYNDRWFDYTGTTLEEMAGWGWQKVHHPDFVDAVVEKITRCFQTGELWEDTFPLRGKDGVYHWFLSRAVPTLDDDGKVLRWFGTNTDITTQRQIEEELAHARDAALESVRLKSEFLANMSHEIRTPMNGVVGMTGILLDTELTTSQRQYTETIEASADALLTIIDDILDFSKIESGLLRFEKIDFELRGVVEGAVDVLAELAQAKELELASVVYEDVPTALKGDPGRLRQVLTNLIGNAVKFTEHGEVIVSVRIVSDTPQRSVLRFEVRDTGLGIAPEGQRRLFQAFTQADGSTTRKYGGTGLGLAISKQLVELMGGEIGVDSALDQGSTFWFTGSFEKQLEPRIMPEDVDAISLSGVRALIVDDNDTNRTIFVHQMNSWGMIVNDTGSPKDSLGLLRSAADEGNPYTIAILDLNMPEIDGFQLADLIKADAKIASVALVLLPSYGKRGHGEMARKAGIAAYLQKPVRQSQLYNCLTTVLAGLVSSPFPTKPQLVTPHSLRELRLERNPAVVFSKTRILVAEDNVVNQKVALAQLRNLGYRAEGVSNGRKVMEAIAKQDFDVILMDCQMPVMDGFETTAIIRDREGPNRRTIIIALTANALDGDSERCLASGMDDYLSKPVKSAVLEKKLNKWIKPQGGDLSSTNGSTENKI